MATRKKPQPDAPIVDENQDFPDYVDFQSLNPALEQIKADLQISGDADITCHVSKLNADGNGTEYKVWQGDPDDYNLEALAKKHGSGQYRIMVYMKIPSGQKVRQINKVQAWMLSPDDEARLEAARHPPEPRQADNTAALAGVMAQGFQQLGELIVKAVAKPEVDPLQQMQALAGIMRSMMPTTPTAPAAPNFVEMLNMVKLFNDVAGVGKTTLPEGADSSTALMMAGMDMFKPVIAKAMEQKAQQGDAAKLPIQANNPALTAPIEPQPGESEEFMFFKMQLKSANKAAVKGTQPDDFADAIYGIIPDEVLQGMAFDPAWFEYLTKAVPECAAHKPWYEAVRNALVEIGVEDGVFVRGADGALTLAAEPAQNDANSAGKPADATGKPAAP